MPKSHAYLQTMMKTLAKFKIFWHKHVGGVAHTSTSLSLHYDSTVAIKEKKVENAKEKKKEEKKKEDIFKFIPEAHAHLQSMTKTSVVFQKRLA